MLSHNIDHITIFFIDLFLKFFDNILNLPDIIREKTIKDEYI